MSSVISGDQSGDLIIVSLSETPAELQRSVGGRLVDRAAAKSSRDFVGDERTVRIAGVVAQGLCDVRDPGQS